MTTALQKRIERDLDFLRRAFPHLQEQFPDGYWWVDDKSNTDSYRIHFQDRIEQRCEEAHYFGLVRILSVGCDLASHGYTAHGLYFPTIYAAAEFIGRASHALTPTNASAAALEARFGGAS